MHAGKRQTGGDTVLHPVAVDSCEAPFLLQAESKTSKTVSSSDRPCQQPSLSCDLIRQQKRTHAHGRGWGGHKSWYTMQTQSTC